jgi:hypothetical protein
MYAEELIEKIQAGPGAIQFGTQSGNIWHEALQAAYAVIRTELPSKEAPKVDESRVRKPGLRQE